MKLPFTIDQFLDVFKNYNQAVYPLQFIFYFFAIVIVFLSIIKTVYADKIINSLLSFFWLWMGIVYHILYFAKINPAAYVFGAAFILQGLLFFYHGVLHNALMYSFRSGKIGLTGAIMISFALVIYPMLSHYLGHVYPAAPTFGLPCPTTIFTIGMLLWSDKKLSPAIWIIPVLWSVVGFFAAVKLAIPEDTGLLIAGIAGLILIRVHNRRRISRGFTEK